MGHTVFSYDASLFASGARFLHVTDCLAVLTVAVLASVAEKQLDWRWWNLMQDPTGLLLLELSRRYLRRAHDLDERKFGYALLCVIVTFHWMVLSE